MQRTLDEMEFGVNPQPTVDPELRATIYSLVSALGGSSTDETARYSLGDDALGVLKDLRKWLRLYDHKLNRLDVARCLAEANIVNGDLLHILAGWTDDENVLRSKVAVNCLEILVQLTMPIEIPDEAMTVNHHRHRTFLQLAQVGYKRAVLHYDLAKILRTVVRVALPPMAVERRERKANDEVAIKLVLYFIRNVLMIQQPQHLPASIDEAEISRSTTIDVLQDQDVFPLILTLASSMGEDFDTQDVLVLEVLFHLLKGVDVEKLFMEDQQLNKSNTNELRDLMSKEKAMLAGYARNAPTRHNRFGTMVWVKRDDERMSTVSGQSMLGSTQRTMDRMDKTKRWNKPKQRSRNAEEKTQTTEFDTAVPINGTTRQHLRAFVEEFLDSGFNPLFTHLRKAIEREAERIQEDLHPRQYFYLMSWFLQAERLRRKAAIAKAAARKSKTPADPEDNSYTLIASVMNQETFVLLHRFLQISADTKSVLGLTAGMRAFTQILLTVTEMSSSDNEEDQEIAENIMNRIFYEETTHDRVLGVLKSYKDQGFGYLDAATELASVFLRTLEGYSKVNVELRVRSRRKARAKKKKEKEKTGEEGEEAGGQEDDVVEAQRTSSERKFDFARFQARFGTQNAVNAFVAFIKFYHDLSQEQLKRAHRFFYRLAFKMEMPMILYRVDILLLFQKMIKGPEGLNKENALFKEWEELVKQVFRRAIKKLQERPELAVEMLFSKIPSTLFYLQFGYEKDVPTRAPRPPAELEVKPGMDLKDQIGVVVTALINQSKFDHLHWVKDVLEKAAEERKAWEDEAASRNLTEKQTESPGTTEAQKEAEGLIEQGATSPGQTTADVVPSVENESKAPSIIVKPDNDERRVALFKDNKLRLLLALVKFQRLGELDDADATWIIPGSLTSAELTESALSIRQFEFNPPTYEDGKSAEDFLRSKAAARRKKYADEDDDGAIVSDDENEEDYLFPAGGPTARKSDVLDGLKEKRAKRKLKNRKELTEEEKEAKAKAREEKEREKRSKIKSSLFVHDSDDETDDEKDKLFFEQEQQRYQKNITVMMKTLKSNKRKADEEGGRKKRGAKKRKPTPGEDEEVVDVDTDVMADPVEISSDESSSDGDSEEEDLATDTPLSSLHAHVSPASKGMDDDLDLPDADKETGKGQDEDEDIMPVRQPIRRTKAGFIIDSDSE